MKILFIAYHFEPYPGVGSQRISYWAKHLNEVAPDIKVDVITATKGCIQIPNGKVIYNEKKGTGLWTKFFKTDPGASWGYDIKKWLLKNGKSYDIVLFTGGPFLHFRVAKWIKKHTAVKIIFDFRDPMSLNPRNKSNKISLILKNRVMRIIERNFNKNADVIISVNKWCLSLLLGIKNKKKIIIDNGFDEIISNEVRSSKNNIIEINDKIRFVYAGKFYPSGSQITFLEILKNNTNLNGKIEFFHIGEPYPFLYPYKGEKWFIEFGQKSYYETLSIIKQCDYGLIFPSGHPFESTTKIFDYIGMGLNVLMVANIVPIDGALVEYSKNYQQIEWVKNCQLKSFLCNNISKLKGNRRINYELSRKAGLLKLCTLIKEITS